MSTKFSPSRKKRLMDYSLAEVHETMDRKKVKAYMSRLSQRKSRYHYVSVMAKVANDTTEEELQRLLENCTRTLHVSAVTCLEEFTHLLELAQNAIAAHQLHAPLLTSLAIEVHGDSCRLGRLRNNCSILLIKDCLFTMCTNIAYRNSGFKEICYAANLRYYIKLLKVGQEVFVGREVRTRIIRILGDSVTMRIETTGLINSFERVFLPKHCYTTNAGDISELYMDDLQLVAAAQAAFVVMPNLRSAPFCRRLRNELDANHPHLKLIGAIDYHFLNNNKRLSFRDIIATFDYLWLPTAFTGTQLHSYILKTLVPICRSLKVPIIGAVPLENCMDFRKYENHEFLFKLNTMYIEKSQYCRKYPLIVTKLLPHYHLPKEPKREIEGTECAITTFKCVTDYVQEAIDEQDCYAIIYPTLNEIRARKMSAADFYAVTYIVVPLDAEDPVENQRREALARALNLHRKLQCIVYTQATNPQKLQPIEFCIEYLREMDDVRYGDFIVTMDEHMADGNDDQFQVGEIVVSVNAYHLPAPPNPDESSKH